MPPKSKKNTLVTSKKTRNKIKIAEIATKSKLPTGRPTKYKPEYDDLAYKFCLLGATDAQLAVNFDVHIDSIEEWKLVHPNFSESIKNGREVADANVGKSLYSRAMGYEHPEDEIFCHRGEVTVVPTIKHYPPDPTALIFWLKNRRPDLWRDRQEIQVDSADSLKLMAARIRELEDRERRRLLGDGSDG